MANKTKVLQESPVVEIFWTGGWDSSYRILCLSQKEVTIQPYYLGDKRQSELNELTAIEKIKDSLLKLETTKCTFLPLKIYQSDAVEEDLAITASYIKLKAIMGSQYDWLARFAKKHNGIELCIHKDDKAFTAIKQLGEVKYVENEKVGGYYVVDEKNSTKDIINLFGNLRLPILEETKLSMREKAEHMGCAYILDMSWFCYFPRNNKPCGTCKPCIYSMEEGMAYRFSFAARLRYWWNIKSRTRKLLSKIKWMIFKKPGVSA